MKNYWIIIFVFLISVNNYGQEPERKTDSILSIIRHADNTYSIPQLADIITYCSLYYSRSESISTSLTGWLRESNKIYACRSASQINQFRVFLLYSLEKFKPNEELYHYIKYELQFADYGFNIAAAAYTARNFESRSSELIELFKPYMKPSFRDELVDITTPVAAYPLVNPTRVRYEILETLIQFGPSAYSAMSMITDLNNYLIANTGFGDTALVSKCNYAINSINEATPACCRKEAETSTSEKNITQYAINERQRVSVDEFRIIDQEGNKMQFKKLMGKPFVLTFFYTRCTNPLKCASTVARLAKLQQELTDHKLVNRVGIYGMTFDPGFDKPSVLKQFGELYGIKFTDNVKFLLSEDKLANDFSDQLQLRVNYGYGSVNQHGTQLFVFDKKGRLSVVSDNELWTTDEVISQLENLLKE